MEIEELARQTIDCGFRVHKELGPGCRADLVIERRLVVEIKSLERLAPVHAKQLLTYIRLMKQPVGLLMNFGCETFREGVRRVVNGPSEFVASRAQSS